MDQAVSIRVPDARRLRFDIAVYWAVFFLLVDGVFGALLISEFRSGRNALVALSLAQTLVILLVTPLLTASLLRAWRWEIHMRYGFSGPAVLAWRALGRSIIVSLITVSASSLLPLLALWIGTGLNFHSLGATELYLVLLALLLAELTVLFSTVSEETFRVLTCTFGVEAAIVGLLPLVALIHGLSGSMIEMALSLNPVIAVSVISGFDILRTEWLYVHIPLGHYRFTYPSATFCFGVLVAGIVLVLSLSMLSLRGRLLHSRQRRS